VFSTECVLDRAGVRKRGLVQGEEVYRMCSLQNVFSIGLESESGDLCKVKKSIECVLYRMCSR